MPSSDAHTDGATNGISSTEYFQSIGQQADQVAPATNGAGLTDDDDIKPVDEIESLCMNCHENVSRFPSPFPSSTTFSLPFCSMRYRKY